METAVIVVQLVVALGIFNVWLLRYGKSTEYRGANASNMREEFAAYGLPYWFMLVVGGLKILLACLLIAGIWFPMLIKPAAIGMAALMLGAVAMHFKVSDPVKKTAPAATMLALSLFLVIV